MREYSFSKVFVKKVDKLPIKQLENVHRKINQILGSPSLEHYKNLKGAFKKYRRVHVNKSYVILFTIKQAMIYFVDYAHHDNIYHN